MELRFTTPGLRQLDKLGTEVLVATLSEGERPPRGVAAMVDWRLAGRISRMIVSGYATGRLGEVLLLPGKPKLSFDKVLLFGVGKSGAFDEQRFREVTGSMLQTLRGLRARTAVVELPGRYWDVIAPERAADVLLEMAGTERDHDLWTLVEPALAQRAITAQMIQERRRIRR